MSIVSESLASEHYERGYNEGHRDGYDDARSDIEWEQAEGVVKSAEGFAEWLREAGLPHLEDVAVRWDAASREIVATAGGVSARWRNG